MLLEPYSKPNCIAMLNTLFPPVTPSAKYLTSQLTPGILRAQRDGFFRYISAMDSNGKHILNDVRGQGARTGDKDGWPLVYEALDNYLRLTTEVIDQCFAVCDMKTLEHDIYVQRQKGDHKPRKSHSDVSFRSTDTAPSLTTSGTSSTETVDNALSHSPTQFSMPRPAGSALERLTRELRKLGDSSKLRGLAKMRSNSTLSVRSDRPSTSSSGE